MIIEELLVKLGFFSDLKGLETFKSSVVGVKSKITEFVGAVEAAGLAVAGFFAHSLDGIDQQAKFAQQVGISIQQLQQLQYAANISGGSTDDLNSSIRGLSKSIFEASEGAGGAVEVFGRLGVATMQGGRLRPTVEVFKDLADKLKNLPAQEQQDFAGRVGISPSTLLLLQKGSAGIAQLSEEANKLGVYSDKDAKKAEEYAESWRSLVQVFTVLKNQIAIGLAPAFTGIVKSLTEWLKVNKDLIIQNISFFITVVVGPLKILFTVLGDIIDAMGWVINLFGGYKNVLDLLGISAGFYALSKLPLILRSISAGYKIATAWAAAFDFAAFGWVLAGIAALAVLALAVQDLWVWFKGGNSIIGDWFGEFKQYKPFWKNLWAESLAVIKDTFTFAWHFIKGFIVDVIDGFNFANDEIIGFFTKIIDAIEDRINKVVDFFGTIKDKTKAFFGEDLNATIMPGQHNITSQSIPLTNGAQVSNIVNNSSNVGDTSANNANSNTFNITVNGGASQDVAEAVKKGIYDASRQAYRNNTSPVMI